MHDEYQVICAAASIGDAGPEELARLHEHLRKCSACGRAYSEFTDIAAQHYALDQDRWELSPEEARQLPDPELLRRRFLQRAHERGILASSHAAIGNSPQCFSSLSILSKLGTFRPHLLRLASAAAIMVCILSAYQLGTRRRLEIAPASKPRLVMNPPPKTSGSTSKIDGRSAELEAEVAELKRDFGSKQQQLDEVRRELALTTQQRQELFRESSGLENDALELKKKVSDTQELLQASTAERARQQDVAAKLQNELSALQTAYVEDQIRIRELNDQVAEKSASLERNDQLLQRDRDIRDLMTARNLHIFDVLDTDSRGKTKPVFGRIFYTEGKSLIFYAYDLNEGAVQNAAYHYRIWGAREGQDDEATSLGIFYSDDQAQRRWVFKCNDSKILNQIDSVFVTLEPAGSDARHPKGQKLLDAYLRAVPNHP